MASGHIKKQGCPRQAVRMRKIIEPSLDASYILTRMAAFKTKEDTPFNLVTAAKVRKKMRLSKLCSVFLTFCIEISILYHVENQLIALKICKIFSAAVLRPNLGET